MSELNPSRQSPWFFRVANVQVGMLAAHDLGQIGLFAMPCVSQNTASAEALHLRSPFTLTTTSMSAPAAVAGLAVGGAATLSYPMLKLAEKQMHNKLKQALDNDALDVDARIKAIRRWTRMNDRYLNDHQTLKKLFAFLYTLTPEQIVGVLKERPDLLQLALATKNVSSRFIFSAKEMKFLQAMLLDVADRFVGGSQVVNRDDEAFELVLKMLSENSSADVYKKLQFDTYDSSRFQHDEAKQRNIKIILDKLKGSVLLEEYARHDQAFSDVLTKNKILGPSAFNYESSVTSNANSMRDIFGWDMRTFLGAGSGTMIGGMIGSLIFPIVGTAIGSLVGIVIGGSLAIFRNRIAKLAGINKLRGKIKSYKGNTYNRSLFHESKYEIPLEARLFAGLSIGMVTGSVIPGLGTVIGGIAGVVLTLSVAAIVSASPLIHAGLRKLLRRKPRQLRDNADVNRRARTWFSESKWDIPDYGRVYFGLATGFTIGSLIPVVGSLVGVIVGAITAYIAPFVAGGLRKIGQYLPEATNKIHATLSAENHSGARKAIEHSTKYSMDMHAYMRLLPGSMVGSGLGAAIGTLFFPGVGTAVGAVVGAAVGSVLALAEPLLRTLSAVLKNVFMPIESSTHGWSHEHAMPLYLYAFGGFSAGSIFGATIGTLIPGVGTVIGSALGGLIGAGVTSLTWAIKTLKGIIRPKAEVTVDEQKAQLQAIDAEKDEAHNFEPQVTFTDVQGQSEHQQHGAIFNSHNAADVVLDDLEETNSFAEKSSSIMLSL